MEHGDTPPYWQPPATLTHRRRRQRPPSPFLNSSVFIILVPSLTILFIFVSLPYFLNSTPPQPPKPNSFSPNPKPPNSSVKKSWDSLNIVLVLFAILCGVFARGNDEASPSTTTNIRNASNELQQRQSQYSVSASRDWYECTESEEQKIYTPPVAVGITPLRRSSGSFPDLRQQESAWEPDGSDRLRFFDDFEPNKFHELPTDACAECTQTASEEEASAKEIPVDTFVVQSKQDDLPSDTVTRQLPPQPPATPPPPPPPASTEQKRVCCQSITSKEKLMKSPPPPPPVTPPLETERQAVRGVEEKRSGRSSRKKSNATTREITSAIASLYNQGKRKGKQRQFKNDSGLGAGESQPSQFIPPPPPPPPPPPSVFHQLFRKGSKGKKIHSVPSPAAPPPPPPPPLKSMVRRWKSKSQIRKDTTPETTRRRESFDAGRPPLPVRSSGKDDSSRSRGRSTLIPNPTPPPSRSSEMKFMVRGDFVRVRRAAHSSRCGSPELLGDADSVISDGRRIGGGGDGDGPSVTCPSPDVNMKADSFIARLHDGWKLEKMNSWREKQKVGQNVRS